MVTIQLTKKLAEFASYDAEFYKPQVSGGSDEGEGDLASFYHPVGESSAGNGGGGDEAQRAGITTNTLGSVRMPIYQSLPNC